MQPEVTGAGKAGSTMFKSIFVAAVVALAAPVGAAVEIDQTNLVTVPEGAVLTGVALNYQPNFTVSRVGQMQSITVVKSGLLTGVDLQLFRFNGAQPDLAFSVSLVDGEPGASGTITVVGRRDYVKANLPLAAAIVNGGVFHVDFSSFGYSVSAGQKFSVLVSLPPRVTGATDPTITGPIWAYGYGIPIGDEGDLTENPLFYDRGFNTLIDSAGVRVVSGADRGFRTYVDVAAVPEPGSWALLIGGFALSGAALRTRRSRLSLS